MKAKWITPAVTAMDENGHVDLDANKRIYDFLIENGMDGILLLGSIGEFFAIPLEEKKRLIREAAAYIDHRVTVYVGTNEMNFEACTELSNYALWRNASTDRCFCIIFRTEPAMTFARIWSTRWYPATGILSASRIRWRRWDIPGRSFRK